MTTQPQRCRRRPTAAVLGIVLFAACSTTKPTASGGGAGTWAPTAPMSTPREGGGAGLGSLSARLPDGRILVAGGYDTKSGRFEMKQEFFLSGAEIYDPRSNTWKVTASMNHPRFGAAVVALPKSGEVLVAGGGSADDNALIGPSAEVYDPQGGTWKLVSPMNTCHLTPSATLLASGDVLVAGGIDCDGRPQAAAEVYRHDTREWSPVAPMHQARWAHSATALADGRVLVAGGRSTPAMAEPEEVLASAELYDPATNGWTPAAPLQVPRAVHAAALLPSGEVIVAGGHPQDPTDLHAATPTAELYDPKTNGWTLTGSMKAAREEGGFTLLGDGTLLMAGGGQQSSAEIYSPTTRTWALTGGMSAIHDDAQLTVLQTGEVLIQGGFQFTKDGYRNTAVAELFHPPA